MRIGRTNLCLKLTDKWTDGRMWSPHKLLISYFVKIAWNTKHVLGVSKMFGV